MVAATVTAGKSRGRFPNKHALNNIGFRKAKRQKLDRKSIFDSNEEIYMDSEEDEEDESEEISISIPRHPLDIKPLGNAYMSSVNLRRMSGLFCMLPEELLIYLLECMNAKALVSLGATCKALYAFSRADELWRTLYIQ